MDAKKKKKQKKLKTINTLLFFFILPSFPTINGPENLPPPPGTAKAPMPTPGGTTRRYKGQERSQNPLVNER
jgi:hypothetical protein